MSATASSAMRRTISIATPGRARHGNSAEPSSIAVRGTNGCTLMPGSRTSSARISCNSSALVSAALAGGTATSASASARPGASRSRRACCSLVSSAIRHRSPRRTGPRKKSAKLRSLWRDCPRRPNRCRSSIHRIAFFARASSSTARQRSSHWPRYDMPAISRLPLSRHTWCTRSMFLWIGCPSSTRRSAIH